MSRGCWPNEATTFSLSMRTLYSILMIRPFAESKQTVWQLDDNKSPRGAWNMAAVMPSMPCWAVFPAVPPAPTFCLMVFVRAGGVGRCCRQASTPNRALSRLARTADDGAASPSPALTAQWCPGMAAVRFLDCVIWRICADLPLSAMAQGRRIKPSYFVDIFS